jgi:magnesium chelatase family protein
VEGSVVRVDSGCVVGIEAVRVEVEVSCQPGRFETRVVGLPDAAVRESLHRIRAAFQSLGLEWPQGRTTINLAPADLRKEGPGFDLPIALGLLAATGQLPKERLRGLWATGELALCGRLRAVRGVLPMALEAVRQGACGFLFPEGNTKVQSGAVRRKVSGGGGFFRG